MSNPRDYAKRHWRKFETNAEHDERVEQAEQEAGLYFERATFSQKAVHAARLEYIRPWKDSPLWERQRDAATRLWEETTSAARELFYRTCDEIMRDGEISEELSLEWDALIRRIAPASGHHRNAMESV